MNNLTFHVYFDGGLYGADGYGSWEITFNGFSKRVQRELFKYDGLSHQITSNISEYSALLSALRWLQSVQQKSFYQVMIFGDSKLVLKQISGEYRCRKGHLLKYRDECLNLLRDFGSWSTHWHDRYNNVRRFGH